MNTRQGRTRKSPPPVITLFSLVGLCVLLAACSRVAASERSTPTPTPSGPSGPLVLIQASPLPPATITVPTITAQAATGAPATAPPSTGATPVPAATPLVNNPPVVSVVSPAAGGVLRAETVAGVTVSAGDDTGVVQIELYLDGLLYRTWTYPFGGGVTTKTVGFAWDNPDPGTYTFFARAVDAAGLTATSVPFTVTVTSSAAEPEVTVTPTLPPPETPVPPTAVPTATPVPTSAALGAHRSAYPCHSAFPPAPYAGGKYDCAGRPVGECPVGGD